MQELARYLLANLTLDFQGDITTEKVREFLRDDDSPEARKLLAKVLEDDAVDDLLITLADCLKEYIQTGINEGTLRDQLRTYADS